VFTISKAKISSWEDLKKTNEATFDLGNDRTILLRGVTEGERRKATEQATEMRFNKTTKEDEEKLNVEEFGFHLIIAGWAEPEIPGDSFKQKKEELDNISYNVLKKIARKIDALSDIPRTDIEAVKND